MDAFRQPSVTDGWPARGIEITRSRNAEFLAALIPREELRALASLEHSDPGSILRFAPEAIPGETIPFLGVRLRADQPPVKDGARAEVALAYPFREGSTVSYRWEFLVPASFVNDHPQNRRNTIAQWHDQPDTTRGERWETKPVLGSPVSLRLTSRDGRSLQLSLQTLDTRAAANGRHEIATIAYDRWIAIEVRITWSQDPDRGAVAVHLDGEATPSCEFRGFTMNNRVFHYLKVGLYRSTGIRVENRLYLRRLTCETLADGP